MDTVGTGRNQPGTPNGVEMATDGTGEGQEPFWTENPVIKKVPPTPGSVLHFRGPPGYDSTVSGGN